MGRRSDDPTAWPVDWCLISTCQEVGAGRNRIRKPQGRMGSPSKDRGHVNRGSKHQGDLSGRGPFRGQCV